MKFRLIFIFSILTIFSLQAQNSVLTTSIDKSNISTKNNTFLTLAIDKSKSAFTVKGTSTLHDWEMVSEVVTGSMVSTLNNGLSIKSINLSLASKSLKSGKKLMDKKCYEALKTDIYPTINYQFNSIKKIELTAENNYKATLIGSLTIAGITKNITTDVKIELNEGDLTISTLNIKGKEPLKMSDFKVIPPTVFFGTLKTGNEITIEFNLNYI